MAFLGLLPIWQPDWQQDFCWGELNDRLVFSLLFCRDTSSQVWGQFWPWALSGGDISTFPVNILHVSRQFNSIQLYRQCNVAHIFNSKEVIPILISNDYTNLLNILPYTGVKLRYFIIKGGLRNVYFLNMWFGVTMSEWRVMNCKFRIHSYNWVGLDLANVLLKY